MNVPADTVVEAFNSGAVIPGLVGVVGIVLFVGLTMRWARWAGRQV